jgi:hypothetical protein
MKAIVLALAVVLASASNGFPEPAPFDRLPSSVLDAEPPTARVHGAPGAMAIRRTECRLVPATQVRRRIVELAVQEWGYFGFTIADQTEAGDEDFGHRRGRRRPGDAQSARVADSIGGYWTAAPGGDWILDNQNKIWNSPDGTMARWRFPWSAAFVSWVMCEAGLGSPEQFQRAIAHHVYIDQAIQARDRSEPVPAFVAHDVGETDIAPGDLLCTARRPAYRALAERRLQIGQGARTHCDIVVKMDRAAKRVLAIGGNVRGSVTLKIVPLVDGRGVLRPPDRSQLPGGRAVFAHLKLRAAPIDTDPFDTSATIRALACAGPSAALARTAASSAVGALRCAASTDRKEHAAPVTPEDHHGISR